MGQTPTTAERHQVQDVGIDDGHVYQMEEELFLPLHCSLIGERTHSRIPVGLLYLRVISIITCRDSNVKRDWV